MSIKRAESVKTTTATHIAALCSRSSCHELPPHRLRSPGKLTGGYGFPRYEKRKSTSPFVWGESTIEVGPSWREIDKPKLMPSNKNFIGAMSKLIRRKPAHRLMRRWRPEREKYDYIVPTAPSSRSAYLECALVAADKLLVPSSQ